MLSHRFKGYKHELHKYYKKFNSHDEACGKPFKDVSAEDWEFCCNESFKKVSEANTNNCGKAEINHCSGSKSFAQHQHELENELDQSVGLIEFWKKTHFTDNGWKTPVAQQLYCQPIPMTEKEIYEAVVDKKPGYARGRGYGEIASSSSIGKRIRVEELEAAREKAMDAEKKS